MARLTTKKDVQQAMNAVNIIPTTRTAFLSVRTTVPPDVLVLGCGLLVVRSGTGGNAARCCCGVTNVWNDATDSTSALVDTAVIGTSLSVSDGTCQQLQF